MKGQRLGRQPLKLNKKKTVKNKGVVLMNCGFSFLSLMPSIWFIFSVSPNEPYKFRGHSELVL